MVYFYALPLLGAGGIMFLGGPSVFLSTYLWVCLCIQKVGEHDILSSVIYNQIYNYPAFGDKYELIIFSG